MITIKHKNKADKGSFKAIEDDFEAGVMTYTWINENTFSIDHTIVNPVYSGQGIGKKLVLAAVDFAREKNVRIIPLCSFAKNLFDKLEEIQDVVKTTSLS